MTRFLLVLLASCAITGLALADDVPSARFSPARDVTAAKVAHATSSDPIRIGTFPNPANQDQNLALFCAGANRTLACDARRPDGTVVGTSEKFERASADVVVFLERTGGNAAWRTVKVVVPGAILSFGGQDMGDF
jgi:hypothetical protein